MTRTVDDVREMADGIVRVTWALPLGIDHVHCYLLRRRDGSWIVVDAGLGLPGAGERWRRVLTDLGVDVERIVVTHFHPDHVGACAILAEATGAPVFQGRIDHAQSERTWGADRDAVQLPEHMRRHGMPEAEVEALRADTDALLRLVFLPTAPRPLDPGDRVDGWEVVHLPGHADGHLCLWRDGVMIAGDAILATISPNVGWYPDGRPDPLADYLASLRRMVELAPTVAFAGHGETIDDPAGRARELVAHHGERLEYARAALRHGPRSSYEVSLELFPGELPIALRRFALAESCAHLEHLVAGGSVVRLAANETVLYEAVTAAR